VTGTVGPAAANQAFEAVYRRDSVAERLARWCLYATTLVPLLVVPQLFFPFVTARAVYFRLLVQVAIAALLYSVLARESSRYLRRDRILVAFAAFVGVNALSAALGAAPMRSMFGDYERMGGVWNWLHLLAYLVALRTFFSDANWRRFFDICLTVAVVVGGIAVLQESPYRLPSGIGGARTGATIGNPGLIAPYLLANIAIALLAATRGRRRRFYLGVAALLAVPLLLAANRSSVLGLLFGGSLGLITYYVFRREYSRRGIVLLAATTVFAFAIPLLAQLEWSRPVTRRVAVLSRLGSGVDSTRVIQWRAAIAGARERPLLGFGPENYHLVWSRHYQPEMYRFVGDERWDRAHNAYLDALSTTGLVGFAALIAIWVVLARETGRARHSPSLSPASVAVLLGFFAGYALYLFFWFFDLNSTMLWIALAAYAGFHARRQRLIEFGAPRARRWQTSVILALGALVFASSAYVHSLETLRTATALGRVGISGRAAEDRLRDFERVFDSPAPGTHHAYYLYGSLLRSLLPQFERIRRDPERRVQMDRAFRRAVEEIELERQKDPLNERILVQRARIALLGSIYYQNSLPYDYALQDLRAAVRLAPRNLQTYLILGNSLIIGGRAREALQVLEHAYRLSPELGQTRWYIATAYAQLGQYAAAAKWLLDAIDKRFAPDPATVLSVVEGLRALGDHDSAAALASRYVNWKFGPPHAWVLRPPLAGPSTADSLLIEVVAADRQGSAKVGDAALPALFASREPLQDFGRIDGGRTQPQRRVRGFR
jgi:O-antigen ligase